MQEAVKIILARKIAGEEIAQNELDVLKRYVIGTIVSLHGDDVKIDAAIQWHFPKEYGEALDILDGKKL